MPQARQLKGLKHEDLTLSSNGAACVPVPLAVLIAITRQAGDKAEADTPPPHGIYVGSLRHSWLPLRKKQTVDLQRLQSCKTGISPHLQKV